MKKIIRLLRNIDESSRAKISNYIIKNGINVYLILFLLLFCMVVFWIPYINLILVPSILWPIIAVAIAITLKLSVRSVIVVCLIFLICSGISAVLLKHLTSELFGNIIYFLLFWTAIKCIYEYRKEIKHEKY